MNKKQWKAEYSKYRAIRSAACHAANECKHQKASSDIFDLIFKVAHRSIRYAIFERNESCSWRPLQGQYSSNVYASLNMELPASHRGHLA